MTWTRQMAQVSHSTSQLHIATAFHFFRENIFSGLSLSNLSQESVLSSAIIWNIIEILYINFSSRTHKQVKYYLSRDTIANCIFFLNNKLNCNCKIFCKIQQNGTNNESSAQKPTTIVGIAFAFALLWKPSKKEYKKQPAPLARFQLAARAW